MLLVLDRCTDATEAAPRGGRGGPPARCTARRAGAGRRPRAPAGHGPRVRAAAGRRPGRPDRRHRRRLRRPPPTGCAPSSTRSRGARRRSAGAIELGAPTALPAAARARAARGASAARAWQAIARRAARASTTSSPARRSASPPRPTRASAARAARRARGRGASSARSRRHGVADRAARAPSASRPPAAGSGARRAGLARRPARATAGWPSAATTASDFPLERPAGGQGAATISVVLPAREVAGTLADVLERDRAAASRADRRGARRRRRLADGTADVARAPGARVVDEADAAARARPRAGQGRRDVARPRGHDRRASSPSSTPTPRTSRRASCSACSARCSTDPTSTFVKGAFRRPLRVGDATHARRGRPRHRAVARPLPEPALPAAGRLPRSRWPARSRRAATLLERAPLPRRLRRRDRDADRRAARCRPRAAWPRSTSARARTATSRCATLSAMALEVLAAAERRTHGDPNPGRC